MMMLDNLHTPLIVYDNKSPRVEKTAWDTARKKERTISLMKGLEMIVQRRTTHGVAYMNASAKLRYYPRRHVNDSPQLTS